MALALAFQPRGKFATVADAPLKCISFGNGASISESRRSVLALAADCGEPDHGSLLVAIAAERMGRDCRAENAFSSALGQFCC